MAMVVAIAMLQTLFSLAANPAFSPSSGTELRVISVHGLGPGKAQAVLDRI